MSDADLRETIVRNVLRVASHDEDLDSLKGERVTAPVGRDIVYHIGPKLGAGGMSMTFFAWRVSPDGRCPAVLKVLRPALVRESSLSLLVVQKEAVALGRLNEQVPPSPFVVRLLDTGDVKIEQGAEGFTVPWLALEYVHGGVEGTTLTDRVAYSINSTGYAFDRARGARVLACLSRALGVVHEVGVVHRDMKPDNVLCCGFGADEIFKVADFGIARPTGLLGTFAGMVGTPGFAAPEQFQTADAQAVGPWTDVFGLAATLFFMLTGHSYFRARSLIEYMAHVASPGRASILDAPKLSLDLRAEPEVCRGVDAELARATSMDRKARHQTIDDLRTALRRWLPERRVDTARGRIDSVISDSRNLRVDAWTWVVRHRPSPGQGIRSVSWDADGCCLAAADRGLLFWDGTEWRAAPINAFPKPTGVRFVHRVSAGRWLIGGDGALIATYASEGIGGLLQGSHPSVSYSHFSGDINDLGVVVGVGSAGPPVLYARVGAWWLKPLPLPNLARIHALARVDSARWLVAGETAARDGVVLLYSPLEWEAEPLRTVPAGSLCACAADVDRRLGLAVGARGAVVVSRDRTAWVESVGSPHDLTAAAIDAAGRGWVGGAGKLWQRDLGRKPAAPWECVWDEPEWTAPISSIFATVGQVVAITGDGGVIEGRQIDLALSF